MRLLDSLYCIESFFPSHGQGILPGSKSTDQHKSRYQEQGPVQEEDQEQASEAAIEDLPAAPAIEGKPRFYA